MMTAPGFVRQRIQQRAGHLTAGKPVRHFALLLQEVHRDPWALELPLERERRVAVAARIPFGGAGDFNTWLRGSDARALTLLRERFPLPEEPIRRPTLIIRFFPDRAVDHLFFRLPAGWSVGYQAAEASYGSDHRPLLGRLRPPPPGDTW